MSKKRALTDVPPNLDSLDTESLKDLVKVLAKERDEANESNKKAKLTITHAPPASTFEREKVLQSLCKAATAAIKKTKHNQSRRPYTAITENLATKADALNLMNQKAPVSDTSRMIRWSFEDPLAITAWLGLDPLVHNVKLDGKVQCLASMMPRMKARAQIESLEVKFEPSKSLLTLKFRTCLYE